MLIHLYVGDLRIWKFPENHGCSSCFPFLFCPSLSQVFHFQQAVLFGKIVSITESLLNLAEVAVGLSASLPHKGFNQFTVTNIRCEGDKRGQSHERKTASRRTEKKDGNKRTRTFDGKKSKSPDLEEIIALLRRIQLSISEGDSKGTEKRRSESQKDNPSAESILDVLRKSGKPVKKGKTSKGTREKKDLTRTRGELRTEQEALDNPQETSFKLTRPPSSFVRKSPIPSLSAPRIKVLDLNDEASPASSEGDGQVQSEGRLEKMKFAELRELAKNRKIKGYSKLRKGELIQILGS